MSNRFHSKWHRHNHHTNPVAAEPDSGHDPIASPEDPFQGSFIINGMVSALSGVFDVVEAGSISFSTALTAATGVFISTGEYMEIVINGAIRYMPLYRV